MQLVVSTLTLMAFAANPTPAAPEPSTAETYQAGLHVAQASRVEQICVDAVNSSGYRVDNILSTNTFSGGAEVIMEVRERNQSYVVGCDYSENTSRIELYQLEETGYNRGDNRYDSRYDNRNDDWYDDRDNNHNDSDDRYDSRYDNRNDDRYDDWYDDRNNDWQEQSYNQSGVRSEGDAEDIARGFVGDQLGIRDPYSEVVQIDEVHRESRERDWVVEGSANGAPFIVRIRSSDASILDFELH